MSPRRPFRPGRRRRARRALAWGGGIVAVLVILAVAAWAVLRFSPLAEVKDIRVEGAGHATAEEIASATGVHAGDKLLQIDTGEVALRVAEVPWVSRVTVDRTLPDTLDVRVEEHAPVLFIREDDGAHLFDRDGREFHVVPEPPPGVIEVTALPAEDPARARAVDAVLAISRELPQEVGEATARIEAPGPNEVQLVLHDGRTIMLGSADAAHDKGRAAAAVLGREGAHWNVSNPERPAMRQ
ncbi:cell division protein FtsQ/DivIB [Corynebacterium sp. 335C]